MGAIGIGPSLMRGAGGAGFAFTGTALPPGATLTRASPGGRMDAQGRLRIEPADTARFDHAAPGVPLGLLVEAGATNILPFAASPWGRDDWAYGDALAQFFAVAPVAAPPGPDGAPALRCVATANCSPLFLRCRGAQPGPGPFTMSVYLRMQSRGDVAWWSFSSDFGDADDTDGFASTQCDRWVRATVSSTLTATRSFADFNLTVNGLIAATGMTIDMACAQLEPGNRATSFIATGAGGGTRAADRLVLDWRSRGVGDGTHAVRYVFDDGSSDTVPTTIADGHAAVPTTLRRAHLRAAWRL